MRYDCTTHLFPLTQELRLLLQDLFIEVGVKQEAAALPLHHGAAELSETLLEATPCHSQLKEETLGQSKRLQFRLVSKFKLTNIFLKGKHLFFSY